MSSKEFANQHLEGMDLYTLRQRIENIRERQEDYPTVEEWQRALDETQFYIDLKSGIGLSTSESEPTE